MEETEDFSYLFEENEQKTIKNEKKISKNEQNEEKTASKLLQGIQKEEKLTREQKMEYRSMASLFLENISDNINKTSIEMNEEYGLGIDIWKEFLSYPIVRKYISELKREKMELVADADIMEGGKDGVAIKKMLNESSSGINNSRYIMIRLPEKVEYDT